MGAPRWTWPLGRGLRPLVRVPRRRDPPVRARPLPRQPLGAAAALHRGRLPPERRPGRPGHRVSSATCGRSTPTGRSSSTSAPAPATPPTRPRREWIDRYRGQFDDGWDAWRERTYARQLELGVLPPGTALSPRPPWVPAWDDLDDRRTRRWPPGSWSASPASSPTPTPRSAGCSRFLDDIGDLDDTLRHPRLRQRGQRRGRAATGSINDVRLSNLDPAGRREMHGPHRRDRRAAHPQQLPVGLDHGRQHAVQALEARGPRRRGGRSLHRLVAGPASASCGGTVRHQFAHAIDVAAHRARAGRRRGRRTRSTTSPRRRSTGSASPTCSAPDGADRARTAPHPALRDARVAGHLPRRMEGGHLPPGRARSTTTASNPNAPFDDDVWELYHVAEDLSETTDLAAEEPEQRGRDGRALVGRGRPQPGAAPRQPGAVGARPPASPTAAASPDEFRYFPGGAQVPETVAVNVRNRSHAICGRGRRARRRPCRTGVLLALGSALGGWSLHVLDGRLALRPQPLRQGAPRHRGRPATRSPAATSSGSPSRRTTALGGHAVLSLSTGRSVAEGDIPRFTPSAFNGVGVGLTCGYEWGPAVGEGYTGPVPVQRDDPTRRGERPGRSSATRWPRSPPSCPSSSSQAGGGPFSLRTRQRALDCGP